MSPLGLSSPPPFSMLSSIRSSANVLTMSEVIDAANAKIRAGQWMESGSKVNFAVEKNLVSQTNKARRTSAAPEASMCLETDVSSKASVALGTKHIQKQAITSTRDTVQDRTTRQSATSPASVRKDLAVNHTTLHEDNRCNRPPTGRLNDNRSPRKPPQTATVDQQQKRPRYSDGRTTSTEERIIEFDEVFQSENASVKYLISQHPPKIGQWYILECKKHRKHFVSNPLVGAAEHLASLTHQLTRDCSLVVRTLGTRVHNCNATLAEKNNKITKVDFTQEVGFPSESMDSSQRAPGYSQSRYEDHKPRDYCVTILSRKSADKSHLRSILDPVVGQVYAKAQVPLPSSCSSVGRL